MIADSLDDEEERKSKRSDGGLSESDEYRMGDFVKKDKAMELDTLFRESLNSTGHTLQGR